MKPLLLFLPDCSDCPDCSARGSQGRALTVNQNCALWASKRQLAVAAGNTTEAQTMDSEAS
jgi:hypothetical protein